MLNWFQHPCPRQTGNKIIMLGDSEIVDPELDSGHRRVTTKGFFNNLFIFEQKPFQIDSVIIRKNGH